MAKTGHVYNPETAKEWKETIKAAFLPRRKEAIDGAVQINITFFMPRPKSMKDTGCFIPHIKKPDADNLLKAVMDALTDIKVWRDDCLVFAPFVIKQYATGSETGAQIEIYKMENE
jgi:Holliday junction resolvase RusA-like endonuclease